MICLGKNIRQPADPLEKISLKNLGDRIRNPHPGFINFITQLRQVQSIDTRRYRELKTKLPYVVAAMFNPPYRKIENFAKTDYFILDIDHISEKEIDIERLTDKLKNDPRVALLFRSPSGDGLKLFFKLQNPFYDAGKYSLFYKVFAKKFAVDFTLDQVVDNRTSDVSRACFVSYDPNVWYNPEPEIVNPDQFINFEDELQIGEITSVLKEEEKEKTDVKKEEISNKDLPDDLIRQIRERLNPKLVKKREKKIYVPEELNTIIELIRTNLAQYNIVIDEIVNINYGKQFRMKLNHARAEINVFYGRKGFSVVKSTKSGLNEELVDIAHDVIYSTIL